MTGACRWSCSISRCTPVCRNGVQLNHLYKNEPALYEQDCDPAGFEWIDCGDAEADVISHAQGQNHLDDYSRGSCNFTPVPRYSYRVGAPRGGFWHEALNSNAAVYGGSNMGNLGGVEAAPVALHGRSIP